MLLPYIKKFVAIYFDDILIYSRILEAHLQHLNEVLYTLRREKLHANTKKCSFIMDNLTFLGYIVSSSGLGADPSKVQGIQNWPVPCNTSEGVSMA